MAIIFIITIGTAVLIAAVYYFLFAISIAIWKPSIARKSWLNIAESSIVKLMYPFCKWAIPAFLLLSVSMAILLLIKATTH